MFEYFYSAQFMLLGKFCSQIHKLRVH